MISRRSITIGAFLGFVGVGTYFGSDQGWIKVPGFSDADLRLVAITQIASHPGIDAVRSGFIDELEVQGFTNGETIVLDQTNANGEFANAQALARKIAEANPSVVFAISTPSSQTVKQAIEGSEVPMVFGAVTDPVGAGLVDALDSPTSQITGTTDRWPVRDQMELLRTLVPSAKKIGMLHNPAEANSKSSMELSRDAASDVGFTVVEVAVSSSAEVPAAARSLIGRVDAIYIPADNTVISAIASVVSVADENQIPLMPGDTSNIEIGGFGTIGHSYYAVGQRSGAQAASILKGESPRNIPIGSSTVYEYYFNTKSAKKQGVLIPKQLLDKATKIYD